ncbi:MAG TPA: N-6 DNA methylase, partial [Verrucomicrobiae bacterium]|nr:N-6 DNA methylase [Verrucomicrobiae bacterium]
MHPLENYLEELSAIRSSGAADPETSGYGALSKLLDAAGHTLKPKVRCFISLKNRGAGKPDGGLFTPDQLKNIDEAQPLLGIPQPSRGVIEVKGAKDELADIVGTKQVLEYLEHYGQLLLTNYRDFLLLKRGKAGKTVRLESFHLADSEAGFWRAAAAPRKAASLLGERCLEYLKRVLLHAAPLNDPKDVAFFVASYARDARARVENAGDLPALAGIRNALEQALGMKFEQEKGEHFFRSTLVQTIFYGVFSAWVLWHKAEPLRKDTFDWRAAAWNLRVPMIKALFEQVATPTKLGPLGLVEVLDWTAAALNRVDRTEFFARFAETRAVQYFYEPFLEAFDPKLRKELGVWYTPSEIVEYQVARVDTVLREELGIADGLADPRVYVLDPCCGTGTYLVAVLRRIVQTLKEEKGEGALAQLEAKQAAMKRVYGFEIMPAPFVVAHLQMGLLLQSLNAPLDENNNERAGIFLTNSLTGWDFAGDNPHLANWPELEAERKGAGVVKQDKPILVILGNPPYNAYAGVSPEEEQGLVEPYKEGLVKEWGIKKFNLDDLYVRFFRLAERRIAEKTGQGIVTYISNFSYLGDPSFVVMRQRFLKEFDTLWFDCLNGDSRETGKLTPDGMSDPSVFSTQYNREGIRVGTTVCLMVRKATRAKTSKLFFRQFWGLKKRADLLESLKLRDIGHQYLVAQPNAANRYSFRPLGVGGEYFKWPSVVSLCQVTPISGLQEMRHGAFLDIGREKLAQRLRAYFNPDKDWESIKSLETGLTRKAGGFVPLEARKRALSLESFDAKKLRRYALYPFDLRWCYYTEVPTLWNRPRPELVAQSWPGNRFFVTRMFAERPQEHVPMTITSELPDYHLLRPNAVAIPLRLRAAPRANRKKKDDGNGEFDSILHEATPAYGAS